MTHSPEDVIAAPIPVDEDRPTAAPWILALLLFSGAAALTWSSLSVPETRPASDTGAFSAERALSLHREILGDQPRPLGSEENAAVRQRMLDHLQSLGYEPQTQTALVASPGSAAVVHNVIAKLEGEDPGAGAVLLVAHHDSVGAGPGASDDGAGTVTLLDIAQVLKAGPKHRRSVIFLWTDGEEVGLFGARAFAEQHPWAKSVFRVINLEARGSSGPVRLFETGPSNLASMRRFARAIERPSTTSMASVIYEQMPNDTDFSVFRRAGLTGYNLAFIGGVEDYHASTDTLENLDPGSLQHLGDQALALVRATADAPDEEASGEATWFDVGSRFLFVWDVERDLWILGGGLVLLVLILLALIVKRGATFGSVIAGIATTLLLLLAGFLAGQALEWALRWMAAPSSPEEAILPRSPWAPWTVGFAVAVLLTMSLGRRVSPWGLWLGTWLTWLAGGAALHFTLAPGAYPLLVPAGIAAFIGLFGFGWAKPHSGLLLAIAAALPAGAAAVLWMPLLQGVFEGLGTDMLWIHVLLASLLATPLIPAIAASGWISRVFLGGAVTIAAATCVAITVLGPTFSNQHPPRIGLGYDANLDSGTGRWLVVLTQGQLPDRLRNVGPFEGEGGRPYPWSPPSQRAWQAFAQVEDFAGPELEILKRTPSEGRLEVRARVRSLRGASHLEIYAPPSSPIQSVRVVDAGGLSGPALPPPFIPVSQWQRFRLFALPPEGAELEIVFASTEPEPLHLLDRTAGLPEAGQLLIEERDRSSEPSRWGDGTWVIRKWSLK
ncbi:MAG: M28 family peptidase [Planctomycetota bacterium]